MTADVETARQWPMELTIERGKCAEMARALRATDVNPLENVPPPIVPTFPVVLNHWNITGSQILTELGVNLSRILAGTQEFEYPNGPLQEGTRLRGTIWLESRERKTMRDGRTMTALTFVTELFQANSNILAVRIRRTMLEMPDH